MSLTHYATSMFRPLPAALMLAVCVVADLPAQRSGSGGRGGRGAGGTAPAARSGSPSTVRIDVTVREGTSMAVSATPDGRTLAIDLQGGIWTLPATGGAATRVTDEFNDARQPAWSPDGRTIAYQGYRDGGYDVWIVNPDGTGQRQLTWGPWDDREPAWSHDGTRIAFSSDRAGDGSYDVWVLDVRTGDVRQVTRHGADDFMPTWSPDDREIAFVSTRESGQSVWAVALGTGAERRVTPAGVRADAPSWGPGGQIVYHHAAAGESRLEAEGRSLTGSENAFPFRVSWVAGGDFFYTADGKIRRRSLAGATAQTVEFTATLAVATTTYAPRRRDLDSRVVRRALGVVAPAISPDGRRVAFVALGDLYVMPVGGKPENLTNDRFLDAEPAWSPDGNRIAWSSDRGGRLLDLWIRDLRTGQERQLTRLPTSAMGAAWSPDGRRIAFLDVDGVWRRANVSVVEVETGAVTRIHEAMFGPGTPTWSPDGRRVALAALTPYSSRFREGTNQILTISTEGSRGGDTWHTPVEHLSIDSRVGAGPAWSPDGTKMAVVYEGVLSILPVGPSGAPAGPPRRVTTEMAHSPTWTADSRRVLYQSMDKLRMLDLETGRSSDVPLDLRYAPSIPTARYLVHAGRVVDMKSAAPRANMDIVVVGNRIRSIAPHSAAAHAGARVVDASNLTVMPGLIEFHSHLQKDLGEAHNRAWLAFGITTVRSPGSTPYEAVEDREAVEAGVRPGPRIFATGYLLEWNRVYYKMAVAVSSNAHLDMELERARVLQHDLLKSYVRMPDLQQKHIVEFAHSIGIPAASHEVYPSALSGLDATEHTTGTSRRGYSPKVATLQRAYDDVAQLWGKSGMTLTPTLALGGATLRRMVDADTALRSDPRFSLYPQWLSAQVSGGGGRGGRAGGGGAGGRGGGAPAGPGMGPVGEMLINVQKAGGVLVAGTDTPNAVNLHAELQAYVLAGMTPFEALRTATVNPARVLGLDAGTVEAGKIADLVVVEGNPLDDISATYRVRRVIANGRLFEPAELLSGAPPARILPETQQRR